MGWMVHHEIEIEQPCGIDENRDGGTAARAGMFPALQQAGDFASRAAEGRFVVCRRLDDIKGF